VEIRARVYRPRRPRESPLFRLVSQHIDELLRVWPERFERTHGLLRPVVERVLCEFLRCGLPEHGFARTYCEKCRSSYIIPYSCRGRSFCPSCEKKRSLLWAEWLRERVLEPVPHRHVVMTIPRFLRRVFLKRRELLLDLAQSAAEAIAEHTQRRLGARVRPGVVVAIATSGDLLQWHPHAHVLTTDGAYSDQGALHPIADWDGEELMRLFRERLLARLVEKHAISQELAATLMSWRHPGFSVHVGDPIPPDDVKAIEDMAGYVVRNPFSLKRLVYLDGQKAVIYRALRPNPALGRNFESMDPLEWLARMSDHIPDPGKHRTLFYGYYANRVRGERARAEPGEEQAEEPPAKRRRRSASWARLIAKDYNVDPLTCSKCGGQLKIVAYLRDQISIKRILDRLGLSETKAERPPPPDVRYVPVDDGGREIVTIS
jgi:hypothetical protein